MKIRFLIILVFIVLCDSQRICGKQICRQGYVCSNANTCVSQLFFRPANNLFTTLGIKTCPQDPCSKEYICLEAKCVLRSSLNGVTKSLPTRPFRPGILDRDACVYARYFCDENIYHICVNFPKFATSGSQGFAVLMRTNRPLSTFFLRQQKLGMNPKNDYAVAWNYHVIFIWRVGNYSRVYDFDSRLPWGVNFNEYFIKSIQNRPGEPITYCRVIRAANYATHYSKTRKVKILPNGAYRYEHPPPTVKGIQQNKYGRRGVLQQFLNLANRTPEYGPIMTANQLFQTFANSK